MSLLDSLRLRLKVIERQFAAAVTPIYIKLINTLHLSTLAKNYSYLSIDPLSITCTIHRSFPDPSLGQYNNIHYCLYLKRRETLKMCTAHINLIFITSNQFIYALN